LCVHWSSSFSIQNIILIFEICSSKVESLMILILFINYYRQWSNSLSGQQRSTFFSSTRCRTWKKQKEKNLNYFIVKLHSQIILILFFLKLFKQGRMLILNIVLINYYRQWSNFSARAYIVRLPDVKFVIYYIEFKKKTESRLSCHVDRKMIYEIFKQDRRSLMFLLFFEQQKSIQVSVSVGLFVWAFWSTRCRICDIVEFKIMFILLIIIFGVPLVGRIWLYRWSFCT